MSNQNYITEMLELKDNNVFFKENCYYKEKIKGITYKIFEGYLSYKPKFCPKCGVLFDDKFEKHGFIISNIKIPKVSEYKTILRLHKQRYLCKHCNKAFTLSTTIANYGCNISNDIKKKIAVDLTKKRSEKDIAEDNDVSPNTVEKVMDSYYETQKLYKNCLPEVLLFDEFKSVKTADGAMSFHMCNGITGQTIDIVEDRRLDNLIRYFFYYNYKARIPLGTIVTEMALSPKSNTAHIAFDEAIADIEKGNVGTIPKHIKTNSPDYKYPHDYKGAYVIQQYLPDKLKNKKYYHPKDIGYEKNIKEIYERLEKLKKKQ